MGCLYCHIVIELRTVSVNYFICSFDFDNKRSQKSKMVLPKLIIFAHFIILPVVGDNVRDQCNRVLSQK